MKRVVSAMLALSISGSVMAWGDREQSALVGLVVGSLIARGQPSVVAPVYAPAPVYGQAYAQAYAQAPVYSYQIPPSEVRCYQIPVVDQWGRQIGFGQHCVRRF